MDVSGTEAHVRPYRARNELRLHADFADVAVLLCVRGAKSGGISRVVSTLAVHNEMLAHRPELLATLYRGFRWHRLGEQAEGEDRITHHRVPHFSRCGGLVSCRYSRAYIMEGAHESGRPLSARELAALDYFDAIAYRVDMRFEFTLAPGEALFMNSFTTLHSRTAFEDHDDPAKRRYLLRLWLAAYEPRPVVPEVAIYGTDRNGIPRRGDGSPAAFERVASADWMS